MVPLLMRMHPGAAEMPGGATAAMLFTHWVYGLIAALVYAAF
jgi:hypothetical protein